MNDIEVLVDSDAFVGLLLQRDAHHARSVTIFDRLKERNIQIATTSLVVAETATVLSHASGQALARTFLHEVIEKAYFPVIFIDEPLYNETTAIFCSLQKRATSMTDCANVAVLRHFGIPQIFSFDKVYRNTFDIAMVQA